MPVVIKKDCLMKHNINLSDEEYDLIINQFYSYFEDGYKFEKFLKTYLEKIGLEEVVVTQPSRDGGIDLTAIRSGIGDLDGQDYIKYCVQAKRYKPSNSISLDTVKAFAYNAGKHNSTGIFITTAKFSKPTRNEFEKLRNPPIILIDGRTLVDSCIDNELGFVYKPIFSSRSMDKLIPNRVVQSISLPENKPEEPSSDAIIVEKKITTNDVRARILSIPKIILDTIPTEQTSISVCFNNDLYEKLSINKGRNYLAGVTKIYRKYGLLSDDGSIITASATWKFENGNLTIFITL